MSNIGETEIDFEKDLDQDIDPMEEDDDGPPDSDIDDKEINDDSDDSDIDSPEDNDLDEEDIGEEDLDEDQENEDVDEEDLDEEDLDEEDLGEDNQNDSEHNNKKTNIKTIDKSIPKISNEENMFGITNYNDSDEDSTDDDIEDEFQKFDLEVRKEFLEKYHPETNIKNYKEVIALTKIQKVNGVINDPNHKTVSILSKFEKTRILGIRAKQLDDGAPAFVSVPKNIIDGYTIAEMELENKKIPFIIRRPLPNGTSEYWKLKDLELY